MELEKLKVGGSINVSLDLESSKELAKSLNLKRYFKFVVISSNETLIVRVSGPKTVYTKLFKLIDNGDIYAGCIVPGNVNTIKNAVHFINKDHNFNIKFKNINGKAYIHDDISVKDSISLERYKLISEAYARKLEKLEDKIVIE